MVVSHLFEKRLPLTPPVKHERRLMAAATAILAAGAISPEDNAAVAGTVAACNGLSIDRVRMLIDRFASSGAALSSPAPTR